MKDEKPGVVVVLGTGGTIAGHSSSGMDNVGYVAAQVDVAQLLHNLQPLAAHGPPLETEQVAQIDSKDMGFEVWRALALRCRHHLLRPQVAGIVVTHGTDTMEETAYFLARVLDDAGMATRPVVLTGAMRPASSMAPDGPQNMRDALVVAAQSVRGGVTVAFAGTVHAALHVRKVHTYRLDAFGSADAGPLGYVEEAQVRWLHTPESAPMADAADVTRGKLLECLAAGAACPRVEVVFSSAATDGFVVQALLHHGASAGDPVRGLVVVGTGNGSIHRDLLAALLLAQSNGVAVVRTSRCAGGRVVPGGGHDLPDAGELTPAKARVALMLALMSATPPPWGAGALRQPASAANTR